MQLMSSKTAPTCAICNSHEDPTLDIRNNLDMDKRHIPKLRAWLDYILVGGFHAEPRSKVFQFGTFEKTHMILHMGKKANSSCLYGQKAKS